MMRMYEYDSLLARSFSKHERMKLQTWAFITCFFVFVSFCSIFKPQWGPLPSSLNLGWSPGVVHRINDTATSLHHKAEIITHPNMHTLENDLSYRLQPVVVQRKERGVVKDTSTNNSEQLVEEVYESPGVIFSLGGFSGNYFHAFTDVLIPLFATSRNFNRQIHLLITDNRPWLLSTFRIFFQALSRYNPVDIDNKQGQGSSGEIHCFSRLILGLKGKHEMELSINPSESKYTMTDFMKFLRHTYSLKRPNAVKLLPSDSKLIIMPRLLIISRNKTRAFTNVNEIAGMARKLGYKVTVAELDRNMSKSAEIMNSCDVVMGVHGAGLTNMVFLPENAVLIQVVPVAADFVSRTYFQEPSNDMNVRYLEYKIKKEESSLMDKYPIDHIVFTKPSSFMKQGWDIFKSIYLDNQNVRLDIRRFRRTLLKALDLLHK
ncbi:Alpha-1,3-arabinosyltransferase XAT2 [Linum perenne]